MINAIIDSHKPAYPFERTDTTWQKVTKAARTCFNALISIWTFSSRYFGSKTWSVQGLVFQIPVTLFKRLFGLSNESLRSELLGAGYHFSFEKTLSPEELKPFLPFACMGPYMDKTDRKYMPPGWNAVPPSQLQTKFDSMTKGERSFFNRNTGLKVALIEKGNEVIIGFGALESLKSELPNEKKQQDYNLHRVRATAVGNLIGLAPTAYDEANQFVTDLLKDPFFKGKSIKLTGQCHGGTLASYVGLKQKLPTVCVNTFPMGVGIQQKLGSKTLKDAGGYITHITSRRDWTSDVSHLNLLDRFINYAGFRTPGNFGRRFLIPSAYDSPQDSHIHFLGSAMQHLGHSKRTLPSQLIV